ncbi:MAG TPA: hypothetical protein VGO00_28400, partial [Kofleriaceae bacterium]|nr:hypothetical protein [Kofleriaceae bacterium]
LLHRSDRLHWEPVTTFDPVHLVRFDASETRLAYVTGASLARDIVEFDLTARAERRRWPQQKVVDLAYAGGSLVAQVGAPSEFRELRDAGQTALRGTYDFMSGISMAGFGDFTIALETRRRIAITAGSARFVITAPLDLSSIVVADHFLVAVSPSTHVVWDLEDVLPARTSIPGVTRIELAKPAQLLAQRASPEAIYTLDRYDITGRPFALVPRDPVGTFTIATSWLALDSGAVAAFGVADDSFSLLDPPMHFTAGTVAQIASTEPGVFVVGTADGKLIRLHDRDSLELARLDDRITAIAIDGASIAARTAAGTLWRRTADGRIDQTRADPGGSIALVDGTVYAARGNDVLAWTTGTPAAVAHLPLPVIDVRRVGAGRLAIETDGHELALFDPSTRQVRPIQTGLVGLAYAHDGTLAAARSGEAVVVIDLATGDHWPIADRLDVGGIVVTPDAVIVAETARDDRSAVYRFPLRSGAELRSWAQTATNAAAPTTIRGALEFRRLPAP